jgi:TldD protein
MERRTFLACAACGAGLAAAPALIVDARALEAYERLDRAEKLRLADLAMTLARRAGATYADLRIARTRSERLFVRNENLQAVGAEADVGFGLRMLIGGAWGFVASPYVTEAEIRRLAPEAADLARANRRLQTTPIALEEIAAVQTEWAMPMREDPFGVSTDDKAQLLIAVSRAARETGADHCTASVTCVSEEKFFASLKGSRIEQTRTRVIPNFQATAVDRAAGRFAERNSLAPARGTGWEYFEEFDLVAEARQAGEEARRKLTARPVEAGRYDLVIDPTNLALTIHESIGHGTELDRALGFEANYAGTSFLTPDRLNQRYGSPLLNIVGERTQPQGLATVAFDDDGAAAAGSEFKIMEEGVFRSYQMAMGIAPLIGRERTNACAYSDSWASFPIQRMPNISMAPGETPMNLEGLLSGVKRGIYIKGRGSWSIDQQRYNFQFGGQLFYEIRDGRLGDMLRDVAYQARAPDFWSAMDAIGDRSTYFLDGTANCGKGQPPQAAPVSHGAVPARFRDINVLNTERQDI